MLKYTAIGLHVFEKELRGALNQRVDQFIQHMRKEFATDPELTTVKSKRQWMLEYKRWCTTDEQERLVLDFLLEKDGI